MIDVKQLIDEYCKSLTVREKADYTLVTPLFFHIESDESIVLKFSENEDGIPRITDCGTTIDYLEQREISIEKYREKLNAIKERFFIEEKDGTFFMLIPTRSLQTVGKYVGYFIQAISVIANIDL